ncbi:hypothetical protein LZ30DRAFT_686928 [Colletotrichum cereale]|nr:hypothetical protein LZ30DRAFT_686928 [Colletotrichum cereale]
MVHEFRWSRGHGWVDWIAGGSFLPRPPGPIPVEGAGERLAADFDWFPPGSKTLHTPPGFPPTNLLETLWSNSRAAAQSAAGMAIILHFPGHQNRRTSPLAKGCSIQQIEGGQKQAKETQPPIHSFSPSSPTLLYCSMNIHARTYPEQLPFNELCYQGTKRHMRLRATDDEVQHLRYPGCIVLRNTCEVGPATLHTYRGT